VPMRQGGGAIGVDHDNDGDTSDVQTLRSAIVLLDITNPEVAPKLIAEIADANLGMTLSMPALAQQYRSSGPSFSATGALLSTGFKPLAAMLANKWQLVFGSGPYPFNSGSAAANTSSQNGYLFSYDLVERELYKNSVADAPESFFTGFRAQDWDNDGSTDAVYFGSVSHSVASQKGKLFRWKLLDSNSGSYETIDDNSVLVPEVMLDMQQPITATPSLTRSSSADRWVHFGTGRFYVNDDRSSTNQQSVYGVMEPRTVTQGFTWGTVDKSTDLVDVSTFEVTVVGKVIDSTTNLAPTVNRTEILHSTDMPDEVAAIGGWYRNLSYAAGSPAGRSLREPLVFSDQLIFSEYLPSGDQCDINGRSSLYVLDWSTGLAPNYNVLNKTGTITDDDGNTIQTVKTNVDLGIGEFSGITVFETTAAITVIEDENTIKGLKNGDLEAEDFFKAVDEGNCVFVQSSTGEMICRKVSSGTVEAAGRQSWREIEMLF